ncbi:MAG: 23S rRNA (guanosine(2251)-2'-O)-methyltransferase RlmB [Christensenellales bacterium]
MAYYDQFTKKPRSPRDDWRDDEETLRPERDGEQNRRPYGSRPNSSERRPYGDRPNNGERRSYGDHPSNGERRSYGDRPNNGERRPYGDRPSNGERRPYGERPNNGERRPYGERPNNGERRPYGERPNNGERRPYGDRPNNGERRPYGERPNGGERRPYGDRPNNGERRPYGDRPMNDRRPPMPRPAMTPPVQEEEMQSNLLVGRNPIREALKVGRDMEKLLVAKGELIGSAREIVAMAREQKVIVQEVDRAHLDAMAPGHQGLIAVVSAYAYKTVDDMLALAKERGEEPFLVILDGVTDPHNLGAIIRSAECAGAHGVIIPERRAVGLTPAAVKASAGAVEYLPVAREVNLTRTIERLKKEGIWIYGTAMNGEDYRKVDYSGAKALVIGSEGEGMSRLVSESCDKVVTLPMKGKIESLNASVAAGILLYAMMDAK